MSHFEKTVKSEVVHKGIVFDVYHDVVELEDGNTSLREVCHHPGAVAVLALYEGNLVLVRQFRYAAGEEMIEIPAGKLEKGEDPKAAALREMEEETGMRCRSIAPLGKIFASPGILSESMHLYFTDDMEYIGESPDEGEFLSVNMVSPQNFGEMIRSGRICDSKTLCAYALAKEKGLL